MNNSILNKLQALVLHHEELSHHLSNPALLNNPDKFRSLSKEYADLEPLAVCFKKYQGILDKLEESHELLQSESDPLLLTMAEEESKEFEVEKEALEKELSLFLVPKDPHDEANIFLEIRAGTGGDEAALFAGDLLRMYVRFAEEKRWNPEIVSQSDGEHGGYKEVIIRIAGRGAYSQLKFESGGHRVQRVPITESSGRIHTSACTIAVLPEIDEIEHVAINPADLRVDTYRSSGAGGQHVNKTDSAIRITHIPSGIVIECQDERSQHKNRSRAMSLLQSRLLEAEQEKQTKEQASTRKLLVGSGDRSARIRTYNYPQGRVTDHRVNLTLYQLTDILNGRLDLIIDPLVREYQAEALLQVIENDR